MSKIFRQGDVLLRQIGKLPEECTENEDNILARGETTGHSHRVEGARVLRSASGQLLVLAEKNAELVHEEHGHIQIPEGVYEVIRQREYNPIEERQVSD